MAEDNNNKECKNIHNPNIFITSNNNNLESYELDNYIVRINNLNEGPYNNSETKKITKIFEQIFTNHNTNNIVAIFIASDYILQNYILKFKLVRPNLISHIITFNLIDNTNKEQYLADIWNCRANILITFITNDDILHDYTSNHYLDNAIPFKINTYTHQKLTIVFDPHKQSTSSNHPNPVNPNNLGFGLYN